VERVEGTRGVHHCRARVHHDCDAERVGDLVGRRALLSRKLNVGRVRRSHTTGDEFMSTTKTKLRQRIIVPSEATRPTACASTTRPLPVIEVMIGLRKEDAANRARPVFGID